MAFAVRIKTQMSYEDVEELVQRSCSGACEIGFEGLDDHNGTARKVMTIDFESEADRNAFRAALGRKYDYAATPCSWFFSVVKQLSR